MMEERVYKDIPSITKEQTVEELSPGMREYPFVYKGMDMNAYWEEREYYESNWPLVKSGKYKPLWVQRGEVHERL